MGEKGSYSSVTFNALKNTKYYINIKGTTNNDTDCVLSVKFPKLVTTSSWNTVGTYSTSIGFESTMFKPIIIDSYSLNTFDIETSYAQLPSYYLQDTIIYIYDKYGNILAYNDNYGGTIYSKIIGINCNAGDRLIVMISYSTPSTDTYFGFQIKISR